MSKESSQPQQNEEVDLGQLFKFISNAFSKFFKSIENIFYKLFLTFVWLVFFTKQHFIKIAIAGVIGMGLGFSFEKTSDPVYKSHVTIKQNYKTGDNLYNSIDYYNDLVEKKDFNTLKSVLGFKADEASSILSFEINPVISSIEELQEFDRYIKTLDSITASKIDYETFIENNDDYNHEFQQVTITAKKRNNFKAVFDNIVKIIESNPYFKRQQEKDIANLNNRQEALNEALLESNSLQDTYKRFLEGAAHKKGSEIDITFEGNNELVDKTKEYDLFLNDLEIRRELVDIERRKTEKELIVEILSSKRNSGSVDNRLKLFGELIRPAFFYAILLTFLTFSFLLGHRFLKFLEAYKNKI